MTIGSPASRFTGRHMWLVMVGFFGLVIAVNFTMAWVASRTFGGTIVDNSYVASQKFNGWLRAARTQDQLGWHSALRLDGDRHVILKATDGKGGGGFTATGTAHHPLGMAPDVPLAFTVAADGTLHSAAVLPHGRWLTRIAVSRDGQVMKLAETLQ
jgi:nitrogen fixation protein FixH